MVNKIIPRRIERESASGRWTDHAAGDLWTAEDGLHRGGRRPVVVGREVRRVRGRRSFVKDPKKYKVCVGFYTADGVTLEFPKTGGFICYLNSAPEE